MAAEALTKGVLPRVQWGPVITGVLCALAVQIVLGLFGVAFGFASAPAESNLGVLAGIWGLVTPIVASFIGAWVATRIAADRAEAGAYLHGALVWCIGLIAGAVFITGSLASGAMATGTAASGVGARVVERRDTSANRARAEDAARGAAVGTGAAGVAALLGLGGALLGAAVGRRTVMGGTLIGRHGRFERRELRREYGHGQESGVAYGERGAVTTRPPGMGERPEDPGLHH